MLVTVLQCSGDLFSRVKHGFPRHFKEAGGPAEPGIQDLCGEYELGSTGNWKVNRDIVALHASVVTCHCILGKCKGNLQGSFFLARN